MQIEKKKKQIQIRHLFTSEELNILAEEIKGNEIGLMAITHTGNLSQSRRINLVVNELNIEKYHHICFMNILYWYSDNKYIVLNKASTQHLTKKIFVLCGWSDYRINAGNEVYNQLIADSQIAEEDVNKFDEIIPYNDGLYDLSEKKWLGPNPDFYFTRYLTVDFSESTECPKFKKFIEEILPFEKFRIQLLTYLAYSFTPRVDVQINQFWTGDGNNGKSTLSEIIGFMMDGSVSHVEMKRLLNPNDRFSRAFLKDKMLNICSEVSSKHKMNAEAVAGFKRLSDKFQHGENKGVDQMEWINTAKIIFLMNTLPRITAYCDFAFFRRIEIIPFTVIIPTEKIIKELSTILYNEEGSQIAAYILSHYPLIDDVLKQDAKLAEELWMRNTDTIFQFIDFYCDISPHYSESIEPIYANYENWCQTINKKSVNLKTFIHIIESHKVVKSQTPAYEDNAPVITKYGIRCTRDFKPPQYLEPEPEPEPETIIFTEFVNPVKEKKMPILDPPKYLPLIITQFKNMQEEYEDGTYFDDGDIYEPLSTQISKEEYQTGIDRLKDAGKVEMKGKEMRLIC